MYRSMVAYYSLELPERQTGLHGQAVKTSPFHGGNTGSIPVGVSSFIMSRKGMRTFSSVG